MRVLLVGLLSCCLLVSSVSPALAQLAPVGRQIAKGALNGKLPGHLTLKGVEQGVSQKVLQTQLGRFASISQLPHTALEKVTYFHHDFMHLAKDYGIKSLGPRVQQSLPFFREYTQQSLTAFSASSATSIVEFLTATPLPVLENTLQAFSSAGAIAFLGSAQDAKLLISFYEQAAQGPFKEVAATITARGLLRMEAYDTFNAWVKTLQPRGTFWSELSKYVQKHHLPVSFQAQAGEQTFFPKVLVKSWLVKGNPINELHADFSVEATEKWFALGKEEPLSVSVAAPENVAPAQVTLGSADLAESMAPLTDAAALSVSAVQLPADAAQATAAASSQTTAARVSKAQAPAATQPAAATPQKTASSTSGILYSGFPFFTAKNQFSTLVQKWHVWKAKHLSKNTIPAEVEEPGLHDRTVKVEYASVEVPGADDVGAVLSSNPTIAVPIEESGFKFTVETDAERILHNVSVSLDPSFKTDGYNRLTLSNQGIFQLRNFSQKPENLGHLFIEFSNRNGELWHLLQAPFPSDMTHNLHIKFERKAGKRSDIVHLKLFREGSSDPIPVVGVVDRQLLPANANLEVAHLVAYSNGEVAYAQHGQAPVVLKDYYIRLPKGDSRYWVPMLQQKAEVPFSLHVRPTTNKMKPLAMLLSLNMLGMGKTISPELKSRSDMSESQASTVMFAINNITPALMGFLRPALEKYGEASILRLGSGFFLAGGAIALATGLHGWMGNGIMSGWQLAGFLASTTAIAVGTNITRLGQNLAIGANLGEIKIKEEKETEPLQEQEPVSYDAKYLTKRMHEVFTGKTKKGADAVVWYQVAQMFKNLGTLGFLALPWIGNTAAKALFDVELGLDFSFSYVPYSLLGVYTVCKLGRMSFKDAVPTNVDMLKERFDDSVRQVMMELTENPLGSFEANKKDYLEKAKNINKTLEPLAKAKIRQDRSLKKKHVIANLEQEAGNTLSSLLEQAHLPAEQVKEMAAGLQKAFDSLDHRDVSFKEVFKEKGVLPSALAMMLATVHELSVSNGFAFAMRAGAPDPVAANALTALALYGSMSAGRLGGNWLSRRISSGSMYAISSSLSLGGTALMTAAVDNPLGLAIGAGVASLGVGNFFSQMFDYMMKLNKTYEKDYKREISLIINYTMPAAAVLSMPMRSLVGWTGMPGLDLMVAGGFLAGSLLLTPGMFKGSSIIKAIQQKNASIKDYFKRFGKNSNNSGGGLDDAAAAH